MTRAFSPNWCIHYRSPSESDVCSAGLRLDRFHGVPFEQRPCFLTGGGQSKPGAVDCVSLRRPTAEEIRAEKERRVDHMVRFMIVLEGIADWRRRWRGQAHWETVECPACKGRLHLSIAGRDHVTGACETEGCVSWRE